MKGFRFSLVVISLASACLGSARLHAAERVDVYEDPLDQRRHATVHTEVSDGQLRIVVSAIGQGVDALPGFRGRAGANMQTAYEITQLLLSDRLEVLTYHESGRRQGPWYLKPGTWGRLPERRLSWRGDMDYHAQSEQSYWLGFTVNGSPLSPGLYHTEIWSRGELRLRIDCRVDRDGQGAVVHFEEVPHGAEYLKKAGTLFRYVAATTEQDAPYQAPTTAVDWKKRDADAKWVFFKRSHSDGARLKDWMEFLQGEKDYDFLETIALYEIDAFIHYGIGEILAQAEASNWLRLLDWLRGDEPPTRGYGWSTIDSTLLAEQRRDVVYSWIVKHDLEDQYPDILTELIAAEAKPVDVSKFAPPFPRSHFTRMLAVPEELKTLPATANKAKADTPYIHQALRTIDAVVIAARTTDKRFLHKLEALRAHPHERIRQAVFLAYTHFPIEAIPTDLKEVVENEDETAKVREAALLAHSYRNDPEIYSDLLPFAAQPEHPAWKAAVSRLGEIGDRFALNWITELKRSKDDQSKHAKACATEIKQRLDEMAKNGNQTTLLQSMFLRAAWMRQHENPQADAYFSALIEEAKTHREVILPWLGKGFKAPIFVSNSPEDPTKRVKTSVAVTLVLRELVTEATQALSE